MKRNIYILLILLIVQLGLVAGLGLGKKEYAAFSPEEKLLSFAPADIDSIRLEAAGGQFLVLKKENGHWLLPDHYNFPASATRIEELLQRLADVKKGWPVATTEEAWPRFKVSPTEFERHLILKQGEKVAAELFLGSSPSFRKSHVRPAGATEVVVAEISDFDAEARMDDWLDRDFLKHPESEISAIELPAFSLVRKDDKLVVADLAAGEEVVADKVAELVKKIANLSIETVLGPENKREYHQDMPDYTYTLKLKSGEEIYHTFSKAQNDEHYVLKVSTNDNYFKVLIWQVEDLRKFDRAQVVHAPTAAPAASAAPAPQAPQSTAAPDEETSDHGPAGSN